MTAPQHYLATNSQIREPKLTVRQCADYLGISPMSAYRLVHSGDLRSIKVGRSFRVPLSAFREYLGSATYQPGGAA
jgi:excisionase family DNA binding protein